MSTKATMKANRKNSHRASLITRWKMIRQAAPVSPAAVDVVMTVTVYRDHFSFLNTFS